jgi:hypothetical protein
LFLLFLLPNGTEGGEGSSGKRDFCFGLTSSARYSAGINSSKRRMVDDVRGSVVDEDDGEEDELAEYARWIVVCGEDGIEPDGVDPNSTYQSVSLHISFMG